MNEIGDPSSDSTPIKWKEGKVKSHLAVMFCFFSKVAKVRRKKMSLLLYLERDNLLNGETVLNGFEIALANRYINNFIFLNKRCGWFFDEC